MLKCNNCKNVFTEVMNLGGTKLCWKCYAKNLEEKMLKLVRLIIDNLPQETVNKMTEEVKEDNVLTYEVLKKYFLEHLAELKAGKHE